MMTDFSSRQALDFAFAKLLPDLSTSWTVQDVEYVREIASHAEYAEALENMVAIGARNGRGFTAAQLDQIQKIGGIMGLDMPGLMTAMGYPATHRPRTVAA